MIILIIIATLAILHDCWLSYRRLCKLGLSAELNPITNYLCRIVGLPSGVCAGIIVPHLLWTMFALAYNWTDAYIFYTGMNTELFLLQRISISLERQRSGNQIHPE